MCIDTKKKTFHMKRLDEFLAEWAQKQRRGTVSGLSRLEVATLRMFARWLDENGCQYEQDH
jgi:hypothetical protein